MKKKLLSLTLVLVMVVSLFTACGAPTTEPETSGEQETATAEPIRFLDVSPSPARQEYFETTFAAFEAETGIEVMYESVPWDDAANRLTVLGASGQLPDVMNVWAGWLGQFTSAGWVAPLDDYIGDSRSEFTDLITNVIWKSEQELYGATYTVPDGVMVKGVFVREDWAKEAGYELDPDAGWTYEEYFEFVEAMTDEEQRRYGTSYRGARGAFDPIMVHLQGYTGGRMYDDEGNILIDSPEALEAFERWTGLYLDGHAPQDSVNWGFTEMVDNFTGGLTATLINDSEVAPTCEANMQPEQWTVMPMPTSPDGKIYNTVNSPYSYSISEQSTNKDAAWQLIEFLTRPEINIEYCKMSGLIPVKKDVADDPTYGEDGPYSAFVKQLQNPNLVVPTSFGPFDYTDMHQGMMHEEVQKYLLGQQDSETSLTNITNELEARMIAYLAENEGAMVETPKAIS